MDGLICVLCHCPIDASGCGCRNSVPGILEDGARTFEERHKIYGDNYKRMGEIMIALFPNGIQACTPEDYNQLNLLIQIVGKCTRYAENIGRGGHKDSAHDIMVYGAMLEDLTLPF